MPSALEYSNEQVQATVEKARLLLETYVKALAASLILFPVEESFGAREGLRYPPMVAWKGKLNEIRSKPSIQLYR